MISNLQRNVSLDFPIGRRKACWWDAAVMNLIIPVKNSISAGATGFSMKHFVFIQRQSCSKPYEKHHSTVKDACELARIMKIPNLILYHTEETHGKERKGLYMEEGKRYYSGNLLVPDDGESFEL